MGEENLRRCVRPVRRIQEAGRFTRFRIVFRNVGIGKQIRREEDARQWLRVARRLREAMIETASAGAGHMGDDAIHDLPALLVHVEVLVQEMAKEAAALRNSYRIDLANRSRRLRIIFKVGQEIADPSQPNSHNHRIFRLIDDFINFARQEPTV